MRKAKSQKITNKVGTYLGEKKNNISFLRILLNYQLDKDKKGQKKLRKIHLNTAKTSLDLDQIDINSIDSSSHLIRIASAQKGSMRLIHTQNPDTLGETKDSNTEDLREIKPVALPSHDPYPVAVGHNFLIETSFEEPEVKKEEEELIGYNQNLQSGVISQLK